MLFVSWIHLGGAAPGSHSPLQRYNKHRFVLKYLFELLLHPLKTVITYILSLYILFSAVVPCSVFDNCEDQTHTEQSSNSDHRKDCNNCSPFSICSSASGFTFNNENTSLEPVVFHNSPSYNDYYFSSKSEYYSSLFQPP